MGDLEELIIAVKTCQATLNKAKDQLEKEQNQLKKRVIELGLVDLLTLNYSKLRMALKKESRN